MNKTLRKIIAFALVLTLSVSMFGVVFSAFAADPTAAATTSVADDSEDEEEHTTYLQMIADFFKSIYSFLKYIFYEIFLGKPAPDIPKPPRSL